MNKGKKPFMRAGETLGRDGYLKSNAGMGA